MIHQSQQMHHEVVYLTGVAGVGKSTLSAQLSTRFPALAILEYGALLTKLISQKISADIEQRHLKEKSSGLVTPEHVEELDNWLIGEVSNARGSKPLLMDSHPVTMEPFGFRVTPFSAEKIKALRPTRIVLLTCSPESVARRVSRDSGGRPIPTIDQVRRHTALQTAVAANYSVISGAPMYEIDNEDDTTTAVDVISKWLS